MVDRWERRSLMLLVRDFSDEQLLSGMKKCLDEERKQMAWFLVGLAEVDRRSLYAPMGYSSLFEFCVQELGLSRNSALKRIQAARLGARFKEVYSMVEEGFQTLSNLCLLSPFLTWRNKGALLEETKSKSKREVQRIIRRHFPGHQTQRPDEITPVSEDRMELRFEAGVEFEAKLQKARELLSHKHPHGKLEAILGDALCALLSQIDPDLAKPSTFTKKAREESRYIPRRMRVEVWKRDTGACTFVSSTGRKCCSRKFLEWDHILPLAQGGLTTEENLRLLCNAHNQLEARRKLGSSFMEKRIAEQRALREKAGATFASPLSLRWYGAGS